MFYSRYLRYLYLKIVVWKKCQVIFLIGYSHCMAPPIMLRCQSPRPCSNVCFYKRNSVCFVWFVLLLTNVCFAPLNCLQKIAKKSIYTTLYTLIYWSFYYIGYSVKIHKNLIFYLLFLMWSWLWNRYEFQWNWKQKFCTSFILIISKPHFSPSEWNTYFNSSEHSYYISFFTSCNACHTL